MNRPALPVPDPAESIILSTRQAFESVKNQKDLWLPDISSALVLEATALDPEDELDQNNYRRCPSEARFPKNEKEITEQAEEIAEWIFETYFQLVVHRIRVYNKWRRKVNVSKFTDFVENQKYRLACRLLTEQILRRDLPPISGFDWQYDYTVLPIFSIQITLQTAPTAPGAPDDTIKLFENVLNMTMAATVEVRQRNGSGAMRTFAATFGEEPPAGPEAALPSIQPSWSSSSSSSSSSWSSFDSN